MSGLSRLKSLLKELDHLRQKYPDPDDPERVKLELSIADQLEQVSLDQGFTSEPAAKALVRIRPSMPTNIVKLTTKPSEPMTRETVLIIGHIGEEANLKEDDPGVILDKLSRSGKRDTYLKNAIDQTCDQCLARGMPGVFNELFKRSLDAVEEQGSEAFKLYKQHQLPEHAMDKILNQQHITIKRLQDIHDLSHRVETKRQWSRLIRSIYVVMVQFINMVTVTVVRSNK